MQHQLYLELLVQLRPPRALHAVGGPQRLLGHGRALEHNGVAHGEVAGVVLELKE